MTSPFATPAMEALKGRLDSPMPKSERIKPVPAPTTPAKPFDHRPDRDRRPAKPADHVRELRLLDGRPITIDRRAISFLVACKENPETATVVGMRVWGAKPVPVQAPYAELRKWWLGAGSRQDGR